MDSRWDVQVVGRQIADPRRWDTEECRTRIMGEKAGDERIERETERLYESVEEEENKRTKARVEDTTGGSNQEAASSIGSGVEVQTSRGRVPLAPASKRKAS